MGAFGDSGSSPVTTAQPFTQGDTFSLYGNKASGSFDRAIFINNDGSIELGDLFHAFTHALIA